MAGRCGVAKFRDYSFQVAFVLRQERVRKGLTQTRLGERTGIPQRVVSYYESGRANPTLKNLVVLAEFFGIRVAEFFLSRRGRVQLISDTEYSRDPRLVPGVSFREANVDQGTEIHAQVKLLRQLAIRVTAGKVAVKIGHLERMQLVEAGQWLKIPGGGTVSIVGVADHGSQVQVYESERTEVRGLEVEAKD